MKRNFFAILSLFALILVGAASSSFAVPKTVKTKKRQTAQLVTLLPKSEGVVAIDMKRMTAEALPQLLSGRLQMLGDINAHLEEIKDQLGIDLRRFEQVAAGVNFKPIAGAQKKFDYEPLVLARGGFTADSFLNLAKTAADGKFREEKIGSSTIYLFAVKEILQARKPQQFKTPRDEEKFNKMLNSVPSEIAVAAFDANTLAIGMPSRVRETLNTTSPRVSADLLALAGRQPNSLARFAANLPAGVSQMWNLDNDIFGKSVDSIRQLVGFMNLNDGNTTVALTAKTYKPEQAKDLEETLVGLQSLGGMLGGMKGEDKKVYARIVETAKISRAAGEVTVNMQVAKSDVDILLGKK